MKSKGSVLESSLGGPASHFKFEISIAFLLLWLATAAPLLAEETNAAPPAASAPLTPEQMFEGGTNAYNNWVDLSVGGFVTGGNKSQFQQRHQTSNGAFGGIEDFHFQDEISKGTTVNADGRAIFDNHDYKLSLDVTKEKTGYLKFSYYQYRTWSNGDGGLYAPTDAWFPLPGDALALDRGAISFEGGLTLENAPKITFKYTHNFRDGEKASTDWGLTHPDMAGNPA